jgi:predicted amidohydrolase
MKVAALQYKPPKGDPQAARIELAQWAREAGQQGAQTLVFPEMAVQGYVWPDAEALRPLAEPAEGPTFQTLSPIARAHQLWMAVGFAESDGDALYNSALLIGPTGELAGVYRKVLLYDLDTRWSQPGNTRVVVHTGATRAAVGICMDLNDEGFRRHLVGERPDQLWFLTNWLEEGADVLSYWRRRTFPWSGVMIAANTWGNDEGVEFAGRSLIWNSAGHVLARAEATGNTLLVAEL